MTGDKPASVFMVLDMWDKKILDFYDARLQPYHVSLPVHDTNMCSLVTISRGKG